MPKGTFFAIAGVVGHVVAVGEHGRILHFEGDVYHCREVESPTRVNLQAVWVESPTSAWACGDDEIIRWDGRRWHKVAQLPPGEGLLCAWGLPGYEVWLGSKHSLLNYRSDGGGGLIHNTDLEMRAIWGSGKEDVWYLASEGVLMRWTGAYCAVERLGNDNGEEWTAIAGSGPGEPVYVVGPAGYVMEYNRDTGRWWDIDSGTDDRILAACSDGADSLFVTTSRGQIRQWDGGQWRVVASNAFGAPLYGLCRVDQVLWACGAGAGRAGGVVIQHRPEDGGAKE